MSRRRTTLITAALAASLLLALGVVSVSADSQRALSVKVTMTGDQEVVGNPATCAPPSVCGDPNATGTAKIQIVPALDRVCFRLEWSGIDGTVWGAHIHGPATTLEARPVRVGFLMLDPAVPATHLAGTDSLAGCVEAAPVSEGSSETWADRIAADPSMFYVNVHSTVYGPGAIRAQLGE